jgi:hypothetical protein
MVRNGSAPDHAIVINRTPLKKVATPQDIANQILVVASPVLSGHVTGEYTPSHTVPRGGLTSTRLQVKISWLKEEWKEGN